MTSPDVDYAHTTGAERARQEKAAALAVACRLADLDADAVTRLTEPERRGLEKAAGVRRGSADTWRAVATRLARGGAL